MASVEKSITVKATPDAIWSKATDPSGWPTWFEGASAPKSITGDGGVGTKVELTMTVAGLPLPSILTVEKAAPGEEWIGAFESPGLAIGKMSWQYMPMGSRTKLTFHIEADLKGAAKVMEGKVTKSFENMADETLAKLKQLVEG